MIAVVAILHFAEAVLVPLALALMLAFLLTPLVSRIERSGFNRVIAVAFVTLTTFALLGLLVYTVGNQFLRLVEELPSYRDNLVTKIRALSGSTQGGIERGVEAVKELSEE